MVPVKSYNNSYLLGYIKEWFPNINLIDFYLNTDNIDVEDNSLIYVDDEIYFDEYESAFEKFKDCRNSLLICKDKDLVEYLNKRNLMVHYEPFWYVLDDAISLKYIIKKEMLEDASATTWLTKKLLNKHIKFINKFDKSENFICLNRSINRYKIELLSQLQNYNLISKGFVTCKFTELFNDPGLQKDTLNYYISDLSNGLGYERHNHIMNEIACSSTLRNAIHIAGNLSGHTVITTETFYLNFFTEKSFLFLFCKKMPITFSNFENISVLESEGFDCFTDIINQKYDMCNTVIDKISTGLKDNLDLLSTKLLDKSEEISIRTDNNFDYLINGWIDMKLNNLKEKISTWLH